jgi:acyl carrier protein
MESKTATPRATREALIQIWAEVLDIPPDRISGSENFFQLGGDSLLLTMVLTRINERYALQLTLADLLSAADLRQLTGLVMSGIPKTAGAAQFPLCAAAGRPVPATPAQQGLWFMHELLEGRGCVYNAPAALRLDGPLDIPALTRAFNAIIRRHESLRLVFRRVTGDSELYLAVRPNLEIDLRVIQVMEEQVPVYVSSCQRHCFDLAAGPLFTVNLLRISEQSHVLLWNVHHIISDGWSARIFFRELKELYTAYIQYRQDPLPALQVNYTGYALWLQHYRNSAEHGAKLQYWRQQLRAAPCLLELPADVKRPALRDFRGQTVTFDVSAFLLARLKSLAMQEHASLFTVLIAGFMLLLWRYSGQDDIVVGTPVANRNRPEFERIIGLFTNILALRENVDGELTVREHLARVKQTFLEGYENRDVAFEDLVTCLNPARSQSHTPLFQVMFILQNAFDRNIELPGLCVTWMEPAATTAKYDLIMELRDTPAGLAGRVEYSSGLYSMATMQRLVRHFVTLLHGMVEDPGQRLAAIPVITRAEAAQLMIRGGRDWGRAGI